jgi:hypothetical protein
VDGSQLAAISIFSSEIIVWNYPDGQVLFQKELDKGVGHIEWNPHRPIVFATFHVSCFFIHNLFPIRFTSCY